MLSLIKKKNRKSYIYEDKVINFTNEPSMWFSFIKNAFVDDGDIQLITNRFVTNIYCTASGANSVYSFNFLINWSI